MNNLLPSNITMQFKRKSTTVEVLTKKLKILHFIKQNQRHPSVHSRSKKESQMAWNLKNYTNKLLPSYDPLFHEEVSKAHSYMQTRLREQIKTDLDRIQEFVDKNGYRPASDDPGVVRLYRVNHRVTKLDETDQTTLAKIKRIFKHPNKRQFNELIIMNTIISFVKENGRLPRSKATNSMESKMYSYWHSYMQSRGSSKIKFVNKIRRMLK